MEDIEEMSSVQESELAAVRAELNWRGTSPSKHKGKVCLLEIPGYGLGGLA